MKKVLMAGVAAAALAFGANAASAGSGNYATVFGGYGWTPGSSGAVQGWDWEVENAYDYFNNNSSTWFEGDEHNGSVGGGGLLGVAIGRFLTPNVRVEGEATWVDLKAKVHSVYEDGYTWNYGNSNNVYNHYENTTSSSLSAVFLMANLWYDFDYGSKVTPYVGGGAGVAVLNGTFVGTVSGDPADQFDFKVDRYAAAFQLGGGVKVPISKSVDLDFGYRFKHIMNATTTPIVDTEIEGGEEYATYGVVKDHFDVNLHTVQLGLVMHF